MSKISKSQRTGIKKFPLQRQQKLAVSMSTREGCLKEESVGRGVAEQPKALD